MFNIKNLFFTDDEKDKNSSSIKNKVTPVDLANQTTLTSNTFIKNSEYPSVVEETVFDKEMMDGLSSVIEENNQPGIDYFEFMQSVKNMKGIPSVDQRFQLSFAALQPSGLTVEKIIDSGKFYIQKLNETKLAFEEALSQKSKIDVDKNLLDADQLQNEINSINQKLIELTEKQEKLRETASINSVKISKNKSSFDACYNKFVKEIQSDLDIVNKVLNTQVK